MKRYEITYTYDGIGSSFLVPVEPADTEDEAFMLAAYALALLVDGGISDAVLHIQDIN